MECDYLTNKEYQIWFKNTIYYSERYIKRRSIKAQYTDISEKEIRESEREKTLI